MVEKADVILLIGNRTTQNGTDSWSLLAGSLDPVLQQAELMGAPPCQR